MKDKIINIILIVGIVTTSIASHELIHFIDRVIINGDEFVEICFLGHSENDANGWLTVTNTGQQMSFKVEVFAYIIYGLLFCLLFNRCIISRYIK